MHRYTNSLINESSPYLLQHAHNPVDWHPWSEHLISRAEKENRLLLISIGYAACHWCHVMEHESFEDEAVAEIMNNHFICIKVDREERPDVDHFFMTAVQLMGINGGWPLNCIALPDGRPIWGGTYFPKETWLKNILAISEFHAANPDKTDDYAGKLAAGIKQASLDIASDGMIPANKKLIENAVNNWKKYFDTINGGRIGKPKFPMPVNLRFLLHYGFRKNDEDVLQHVKLTLIKMAHGGIYDQIGGGFARYSVDDCWKVPHFEKMLYDNAQLLSLYAEAFQCYRIEEFRNIVYETATFLEKEMLSQYGAFWSSFDADSEGEEGKYYTWRKEELQTILGVDYALFADYFNINENGHWEDGIYILLRRHDNKDFASKHGILLTELQTKITAWKSLLLKIRKNRTRPGLDDKIISSWNALAIHGFAHAFKALQDKKFLVLALQTAGFMVENLIQASGEMVHCWKNGKSSAKGFLEDYAITIRAFIGLFEITGEESWLLKATQLTEFCFTNFYSSENNLFYFISKNRQTILSNHFQTEDNVIPAANSIMAENLYRLYHLQGQQNYLTTVRRMVQTITRKFSTYPSAFSNWGNLMLQLTEPSFEVAVCGSDAENKIRLMQENFLPQVVWAFSANESELSILKNRFKEGKTMIYVCRDGACNLPVEDAETALGQIMSFN